MATSRRVLLHNRGTTTTTSNRAEQCRRRVACFGKESWAQGSSSVSAELRKLRAAAVLREPTFLTALRVGLSLSSTRLLC